MGNKRVKKREIPKTSAGDTADYPVFCLKYLQHGVSIKNCDNKLFRSFVERLTKLCSLGWDEIAISHRHSYGFELIGRKDIKPKLPPAITEDVQSLYAFRYTGNNLPFLAMRNGNVLHVIFIEAHFGDIYNHG
ncbi:hypothetical protein Barb4_01730 [Bacteroidales bacterium Barb4]|nr:hypothetical protein Barb4_01730 [Bacteroidales bacterium Barb4]